MPKLRVRFLVIPPKRLAALALSAVVLAAAGGAYAAWQMRNDGLARDLLNTMPDQISKRPDLVRYAVRQAKPVFARECSPCHGADMKGKIATGAPNLTDHAWLFGDSIYHIERTIEYGIRSGNEKAEGTIADMRAFGQRGLLTNEEIGYVVQYLLELNGRPNDHNAAELGRQIYAGKGLCYDCHAADAKGNPDYGAPDLTQNIWDYGGTTQALYDSIYFGRHGLMPAWRHKLTPAQIRALAVYVHASSHR